MAHPTLTRKRPAAPVVALVCALGLAGILALAFTLPSLAAADNEAAAQGTQKDEVVYAKADRSGQIEGIYVVNIFETDGPSVVRDPAHYQAITNLTSEETLTEEDGVVTLQTEGGTPFFYQGDLDPATELPWTLAVSYYLDGRAITPEEALGATGTVKIVLSLEPRTAGAAADFAKNYLVQIQGTFSSESFQITDAGDAAVARSGENLIVNAIALPDEGITLEVEGTARDLSYEGWQISGVSLSMAIDLAEQGEDLGAATEELENATAKLAEGASALSEGIDEARTGASEANAGAERLAAGASELNAGATRYEQGLSAAAAQTASAGAQLAQAQQAYQQTLQELQVAMATGNLDEASRLMTDLNAAVQALCEASGAAGSHEAIEQALQSHGELSQGIAELSDNASALAKGTTELSSGIDAANSGASELASGSQELADETSGIEDEVIAKVQEAIDEKLGADFVAHSFVVPTNDQVASVQFIYLVEGLEEEDADDGSSPEQGDEEEEGLIERFFALFTPQQ